MAVVRKRSSIENRNGVRLGSILQLVVGMIVGSTMTFLYLMPTNEDWESQLAQLPVASPDVNEGRNHGRGITSRSSSESGWNTIDVYYGDRMEGLHGDDKDAMKPGVWFAQVRQDKIIVDLVGGHGYFVDLAANDAVEFSNTLALERDHGWTGLCIEPNPAYWYRLSHRKCSVVGALIGETKQKVKVKFRGVYGGIVGKLDDKLANRKKEPKAPVESRYTVPLRDILTKFNSPPTIDYLSLDVEGAELLIMEQFPFDAYTIKILTIERPDKELRQLLEKNDYVFLKDLAWWGETLWAHKSTGYSPMHPRIQEIKTEGKR